MADPVWFWQRIVSPHMATLAAALAAQGREVTYVAEQEMSASRAAQGWCAPTLGSARLRLAPTVDVINAVVRNAPANSIHVCQGLRGNGLVGIAQKALAARGLRQWAIVEAVDDSGWRGMLRRLEYQRLFLQWRARLQGVLAIGNAAPQWLAARNMPQERIFPFAYFLPDKPFQGALCFDPAAPFRFLYVGQFIERKCVSLLLDALEKLPPEMNFELALVGSGPMENDLRAKVDKKLPNRVHWLGRQSIDEVPSTMALADCLILPSRHDGWGAVVSEALMAGIPAICSDACGSAGVVQASGYGGIFPSGDAHALTNLLRCVLENGRQTPEARESLAAWSRCLGAEAGADYLEAIFTHLKDPAMSTRPVAPWLELSRLSETC